MKPSGSATARERPLGAASLSQEPAGGILTEQSPEDKAYWLALSRVQGLGAGRIQHLLKHFGSLPAAWAAPDAAIAAAGLPRPVVEELLQARRRINPDRELEGLEGAGIAAVPLTDPGYPECLRHVPSPPAVLYLRGALSDQDSNAIAVVGTRRASRYGIEAVKRIVSGLSAAGVTIVSGLALGIDAAAHETALEAGGRTIAVLGCGVDVVYPARHRQLTARILERGAVVSEYAPGTQPDARNFPPRNRIISGLSRGVLVVEAGDRSGALITAQFALDQDRDTYAVPGGIMWPLSAGTNRLIQRGEAKLVTGAEDILEDLDLQLAAAQTQMRLFVPANHNERQVVSCLSQDPLHIDEIGRGSGLPPAAVASTLAMLELKGMARSVGGMYYVLVREARVAYTAD